MQIENHPQWWFVSRLLTVPINDALNTEYDCLYWLVALIAKCFVDSACIAVVWRPLVVSPVFSRAGDTSKCTDRGIVLPSWKDHWYQYNQHVGVVRTVNAHLYDYNNDSDGHCHESDTAVTTSLFYCSSPEKPIYTWLVKPVLFLSD